MKQTALFCVLCVLLLLTLSCLGDMLPASGIGVSSSAESADALPPQEAPQAVPVFSHTSGSYTETSLTVTVRAPEGYTIAYTTDGTLPSEEQDSGLSEVSILLEKTGSGLLADNRDLMIYPEFVQSYLFSDETLPSGRVLNVSLVGPDGSLRPPVTNVYFLGTDFSRLYPDCLVVSVTADPGAFLDYETGILASGVHYDRWKQTDAAAEAIASHSIYLLESNSTMRGKAWERPCLVQIYDSENRPAAEAYAGIRVHGNVSRRFNQKGFNLYFRNEYGTGPLSFPLFDGKASWDVFSLSGGGNATDRLKYRNDLLLELASGRDFAVMRSRPAVLFLNGEYWGPYSLTEKITEEALSERFGVDEKQVVVIKAGQLELGKNSDMALYKELNAYAQMDLSDPETYGRFCEVMDVQSMADYFAACVYIGNADFAPDSNTILWRTRDDSFNGGRWQYILYDTEFCAGLYNINDTVASTDHFRIAMEKHPLFAAAIRNESFYAMFLQALKEIGSQNYAPERVEAALASYDRVWLPLMPDFYKRFGEPLWKWEVDRDDFLRFFRERYDLIIPLAESWQDTF